MAKILISTEKSGETFIVNTSNCHLHLFMGEKRWHRFEI